MQKICWDQHIFKLKYNTVNINNKTSFIFVRGHLNSRRSTTLKKNHYFTYRCETIDNYFKCKIFIVGMNVEIEHVKQYFILMKSKTFQIA